jgi:DHA3 family macrolide efflux protein-like MFS transporter
MQGRVFTLMTSFAGVMTPVGLMIAGPIADTYGVRAWYLLAGLITLLLGLGAFFVPQLMHLEDGLRLPTQQQGIQDQIASQSPQVD